MIYPLLTWRIEVPAFTFTLDVDGGSTAVLNVPGGVYWGWRTTGAAITNPPFPNGYAAASTSLGAVLAAALATHPDTPIVDAFYAEAGFAQGLGPSNIIGGVSGESTATGIYLVGAAGTITATSNAVALAMFGLEVGDTFQGECIIARRTAGVWRPTFAPPALLEPTMVAIGSGAISEYNAGAFNRLLFGGRLVWSVKWEFVQAADITRSLAPLNDYLPLANRAPGDTAGTLDDALWALANGLAWALALPPQGTDAIDFREVIMDVSGSIDRGAYTTEAAVGARLYHVTLTMIETTDFDPGTAL